MHKIHELKEKLLDELGDFSGKSKFSKDDIESIKYMASAVDHLCNVLEKYDEEYSGRYYPMGSYDDRSYEGRPYEGRSYERGRGSNAKRDSRGRYSSYSMALDDMKSELKGLMADAPNEQVRQEFHKFMNKLDQM